MRKWFRWIFGGNGRPSIWAATRKWKLHTFKNEISWWEYVKPPSEEKDLTAFFRGDDDYFRRHK